jgi:squalene synthase HpnC
VVEPEDGRLRAAYTFCEKMAVEHYENFPVASVLLPKRMRPHIAAIYACARTADDIADEPGRQPAERLSLLADLALRLDEAEHGSVDDPIFIALRDTIERCALPVELLHDLLSAFRQDVTVHRYATWAEVDDYCRRSANPVGRLVLRVAGVHDAAADRASDDVCTALQLANFWQDFGRDWTNGRLYVPAEEMDRHGASPEALAHDAALPEAWTATLRACVERTWRLFERGRPVAGFVPGRLRLELRATWLGGTRILEKIEALGYDTLRQRPSLGAVDAAVLAPRLLLWR